jgi:protein SCO1
LIANETTDPPRRKNKVPIRKTDIAAARGMTVSKMTVHSVNALIEIGDKPVKPGKLTDMYRTRPFRDLLSAFVTFVFAVLLFGCSKQQEVKHYELHGRIISIDKLGHQLIIDHDAIPGFMEAMTMPYAVSDNAMLDQAGAGDEIKADLAVQGEHIAIDKLDVVKKSAPGSAPVPKPMHVPQTGEQVPNFALINQNGRHIRLSDYRGKTLLITFFYSRCPLSDYCPRVNGNFAALDKSLAKTPALYAKTHLLSISFDPQHDTPEVLRSYGAAYTERYSKEDFRHWEFASAPASEMKDLADFFGVFYENDGDRITHSLSTAIVGPDGKIEAWYPGNGWKSEELLAAINGAATASSEPVHAASLQPSSTGPKQR